MTSGGDSVEHRTGEATLRINDGPLPERAIRLGGTGMRLAQSSNDGHEAQDTPSEIPSLNDVVQGIAEKLSLSSPQALALSFFLDPAIQSAETLSRETAVQAVQAALQDQLQSEDIALKPRQITALRSVFGVYQKQGEQVVIPTMGLKHVLESMPFSKRRVTLREDVYTGLQTMFMPAVQDTLEEQQEPEEQSVLVEPNEDVPLVSAIEDVEKEERVVTPEYADELSDKGLRWLQKMYGEAWYSVLDVSNDASLESIAVAMTKYLSLRSPQEALVRVKYKLSGFSTQQIADKEGVSFGAINALFNRIGESADPTTRSLMAERARNQKKSVGVAATNATVQVQPERAPGLVSEREMLSAAGLSQEDVVRRLGTIVASSDNHRSRTSLLRTAGRYMRWLDAADSTLRDLAAKESMSVEGVKANVRRLTASILEATHYHEEAAQYAELILTSKDVIPEARAARKTEAQKWDARTVEQKQPPTQDLEWQVDALCAQTDPEMFFPEKGGSTRDAKAVCAVCDVRTRCLEYALANDERYGIWGGLSERQRRRANAKDEQDDHDSVDEEISGLSS